MTEPKDSNTPTPNSQESSEPSELKSTEIEKKVRKNRIADIFKNTTTGIEEARKTVIGWLTVPEEEVAKILEQVRAELPTTEALLIGKPQAGKSSIVRGLTGVSPEIIGQGFRPHTQHTERYAYPSDDLPLLIFTDTVGLGDVNQDTDALIEELVGDLHQENNRARVLIWTVKINDFATDTLREIATQLRKNHPNLPCLLAVTCLHEVYPSEVEDHPPYPPDFESVNRSFAAIEEGFKGLCDRAVRIDFTLEEDDYNPVFYGLETFTDALADLLPEAEARTIHQLLDEQASQKLRNLYLDVGRRYILAFTVITATVAAVPLPFATMPVLTTLQVSMVGLLGQLYGQTLSSSFQPPHRFMPLEERLQLHFQSIKGEKERAKKLKKAKETLAFKQEELKKLEPQLKQRQLEATATLKKLESLAQVVQHSKNAYSQAIEEFQATAELAHQALIAAYGQEGQFILETEVKPQYLSLGESLPQLIPSS